MLRLSSLSVIFWLWVAVVVTSCEPEVDWPWFVAVDAGCAVEQSESSEDLQDFEIWAWVNHDRGPEAVEAVWVEASFVDVDTVDGTLFLTPIAAFELAETSEQGHWSVTVPPGETPLDCTDDIDFHYLFSVLDDDGDITQADYIN